MKRNRVCFFCGKPLNKYDKFTKKIYYKKINICWSCHSEEMEFR